MIHHLVLKMPSLSVKKKPALNLVNMVYLLMRMKHFGIMLEKLIFHALTAMKLHGKQDC